MERILIASRGAMAMRLLRYFQEVEDELETVTLFHEDDVEQPWVDAADYAVYLNGSKVSETYLDPQRVVSAAMDAGCDVVHPGNDLLAEHTGFHDAALRANLGILGTDTPLLMRIQSRVVIRELAARHNIPTVPSSDEIGMDGYGEVEAEALGFPLIVKASAGGVVRRVEAMEDLPAAVVWVRNESVSLTGDPRVYLQRAIEGLRTVGTIVVADRHGEITQLGHYGDSVQAGGRWWLAEMGQQVVPAELQQRLSDAALALATDLQWVGIGRVRWALAATGGWYLLGFSAALPKVYALAEEMLGVDLVRTQVRIHRGEHLGWEHGDVSLDRHGMQIRLMHVDTTELTSSVGTLERLEVSDEAVVVMSTEVGQPCTENTDPVICDLVVTAPTRQACLVKARAVLEELVVEGVETNREALLALLGQEVFWRGEHDVNTFGDLLATFEA